MKVAVFKTSLKENEKRIPIHPEHLDDLPLDVLNKLVFEKGYGVDYGYSDWDLQENGVGEFASRDDLFEICDAYILPKPVPEDLEKMKDCGVLCGWTHAVQQRNITDLAVKKKLTLIAWEEMNHATEKGNLHIFYRNNEIAGYAGILHFLHLMGEDGMYGEKKKVTVFGYGSVSRGAIYALKGRGYTDITVYTKRPVHLVADKDPYVVYKTMNRYDMYEDIRNSDIIFNGVLQDVSNPMMFVEDAVILSKLKDNTAIIDISCDKGMGFYFATPTSFSDPLIHLERGIKYYSVDHTPTYLWNAASREISKALVPYLKYIVNRDKWAESKTVCEAIDILEGTIVNPKIIKFQNR